MGEFRLIRSLYRAPIALCASGYLDRVGKESIDVATVEALEFLLEIEIVEKSSIIDDIIRAYYSRYTIESECDRLIESDTDIEKYNWYDHREDEWHRNKLSDICTSKRSPEWEFETFISLFEFREKYHFLLIEGKTILLKESSIFYMKIMIERFYLEEDLLYGRFHKMKLVSRTHDYLRMTKHTISDHISLLELCDDLTQRTWLLSHDIMTRWIDFLSY